MRTRRFKAVRGTALIFFSLLLSALTGLCFAGNFYYDVILNAEIDTAALFSDYLQDSDISIFQTEYSYDSIKWLKDGSEDIYINAEDEIRLHAYQVENSASEGKWAIILHGYGGNGLQMCGEAKKFYKMGYSLVIPDMRGCGESQGKSVGMGWLDRKDIICWVNHIIGGNRNAQIVLYGVSMGGAAVMMTTGESLPQNVKAAIEDCGYSSVKDEFAEQIEGFFGLPEFPVLYAAEAVTFFRAGYSFSEASSVEQVKKSQTPTLFIHGDCDEFVPCEMLNEVFEAAACPKERLIVPGACHVGSSGKNPQLYWSVVERFLGKYVE